MLKKLLKYDLKYVYKTMIVFYCLCGFFAMTTRILWSFKNSTILSITLGHVTNILTFCLMFAIVINNVMMLWTRFTKNLYGDESYLTHTLPVEKTTIYISKLITSIVTLVTSILVVFACIFITDYSQDIFLTIKTTLTGLATIYNSTTIELIIVLISVFFLEIFAMTMAGFTGILLGHRSNDHRMVKSILIGFAFYIGSSIVMLGIIFAFGLFSKEIMDLFTTNTITDVKAMKDLLYIALVLYTILVITYCVLDLYAFKKGIDID